MNIHNRIDESNARHTRFTVFIDGVNCGQLCLLTKDTPSFLMIVQHGLSPTMDQYIETGRFWEGEYEDDRKDAT